MYLIVALFLIPSIFPTAVFSSPMTSDEGEQNTFYNEHLTFADLDMYSLSKRSDALYVKETKTEMRPFIEQPSFGDYNVVLSDGGLMNSSWPMQSHDNLHTGRSPYSTATNPGAEKWRFLCGWVDGGPVIAQDGTIIFGDRGSNMYAVYPNGTLKWHRKLDGQVWSTPALADDGAIYVGTMDHGFYALNPNGSLRWHYTWYAGIASSPAIAPDGTIYYGNMAGGDEGYICALNPDGTLKWKYLTGYLITSDPAIGPDGTVYIGSGDTYLYAMNPDGTLKWRFKTGDIVKGQASIAADGTMYIGSFDEYLYALYPNNGTMKWKCHTGGSEGTPAIAADGTIYVGSDKLYAVYPNGTIRWGFYLGPWEYISQSCPAISADGTIYVGTYIDEVDGGDIIAVNPDGTERWRKLITANAWVRSSPAIANDGTVYIGSASDDAGNSYGYLHAFGVGPLNAHANGPYTGYYQSPVQFTGDAFGGMPPYTYHWDFGDGQTSDTQNPSHMYTAAGNYLATFTVTDSEGNMSSDTAAVTITYAPPAVAIVRPGDGIYVMNIRILPFEGVTLLFGPITVEVEAQQEPFGIDRVEFFLDDTLKHTDTSAPYKWTWIAPAFFIHTITVIAYDSSGNSSLDRLEVLKFF